jgi:hypothetical protein
MIDRYELNVKLKIPMTVPIKDLYYTAVNNFTPRQKQMIPEVCKKMLNFLQE